MNPSQSDATLNIRHRQAMLFCPPQPPLRVRSGVAVVIGRHSSCDLCVPCHDVSRRHAEVRAVGALYEIKDLSSTNGTFVNGERIEGIRNLQPGDRIEIGSNAITFCYIEAAIDELVPDDRQTVRQLEPRPTEAFRGALSEIPPFALLQVIEMGAKTGILQLEGSEPAGRIWFERGRPVHAESEKQAGFDAALQLVAVERGHFRFEPQAIELERTIEATVTELLLEACRISDEG